jgi:hypothetical protein
MAGNNFLDKALATAKDLGEKAKTAAVDNADKIDGAVGKAADFADKKTKGKYSRHIDKAQVAARKAVDKLEAEKRRAEGRTVAGTVDADPPVAAPDPGLDHTPPAPPTAADTDPPVARPDPGAPGSPGPGSPRPDSPRPGEPGA